MKRILIFGITCASAACFGANIVVQNLNEDNSKGAQYYLVGGDVDSSIDTGYSFRIDGDEAQFNFATNSVGATNTVLPSKAGNLARKIMAINQVTATATVGYELDPGQEFGFIDPDAFIGFGCALPPVANRDMSQYKLTNGVEGLVWYPKVITELNGHPTNLIQKTIIHDINGNNITMIYGTNYTITCILQFPEDSSSLPLAKAIITDGTTTNITEWVECLHYNRNYLTGFTVIGAKEIFYKDPVTSKSIIGTEVGTTKVLNAKLKMEVYRSGDLLNFAVTPIGKDVCKNNPFKIQSKINGKWTTLTTINANKSGSFTPVSGLGEITYLGKAKVPASKFENVVTDRQYRIIDELNYVYGSLVVTDNL